MRNQRRISALLLIANTHQAKAIEFKSGVSFWSVFNFHNSRFSQQYYLDALYIFNSHKSDESRINMHDLKSRYKRLVRRSERSFEINKIRKIERLRHSQPREFWNLFIKRKKTGSDIPLQDFF